jgi:hypothetical protein
MRVKQRWISRAALVTTVVAIVTAATFSRAGADEDPWATGQQWLSVRAGFANSAVKRSGDGGAGFGFGYSRFFYPLKVRKITLLRNLSFGAYVHYEVLGRIDGATEVEVPATFELVRHLRWKSPYRPYIGLGAGEFYRKTTNTGADVRSIKPGYYLTFGANTQVATRQLLGIDLRLVRVNAVNGTLRDPPNPVFGPGSVSRSEGSGTLKEGSGTHWSVKVNWSLVY